MSNRRNPPNCHACLDGVLKPFPFSIAFQPIVDVEAQEVFAYEALVRGPNEESAASVMAQLTDENRYAFDQNCRVAAITTAVSLGLEKTSARLSINFLPGAVYSASACIKLTLETAHRCNFPVDRLIFEITESEEVLDAAHLRSIVDEYRRQGLKVALDDFGSGYSGLALLAELPVDHLKLDIQLVRNLPEGVETVEEYHAVRDCGIRLMQGYLFAKPGFERLPEVTWPDHAPTSAASQE